jgi:hypothetical protein
MTDGPTLSDQRQAAYEALYAKRIILARYLQLLLTRSSEDPDLVRVAYGRGKIELDLTMALISELDSSLAMQFPDGDTINRMRTGVAGLAHLVTLNGALNELVAAADEVISTWPN